MAYELKRKQEENGVVGASVQDTPVIGASQQTLSAGGGQKGEAPKAPTSSQKMTPEQGALPDIGRYLDVNQQKVRQLAQDTAGLIGKEQTETQDAIQNAQSNFKEDVDKGTVFFNNDSFNRAREALTGGGSGLSDFTQSPQTAEFIKYYNAVYDGPLDILDKDYYLDATKEAQQAQEASQLSQTAEGRKELLARLRAGKTGRYTRGGLNLDQALIAGDDQSLQAIQTQAGAQDFDAKLEALREIAKQNVLGGRQTSQNTRSAYQKEFDVGKEEQEIYNLAAQRRAEAQANYNNKVQQYKDMYGRQEGVDIANYISGGSYGNINPYNVASSTDYARLQALQNLTGRTSNLAPYAGQAGQYAQYMNPDSAFDLDGYLEAVRLAKQARLEREQREGNSRIGGVIARPTL